MLPRRNLSLPLRRIPLLLQIFSQFKLLSDLHAPFLHLVCKSRSIHHEAVISLLMGMPWFVRFPDIGFPMDRFFKQYPQTLDDVHKKSFEYTNPSFGKFLTAAWNWPWFNRSQLFYLSPWQNSSVPGFGKTLCFSPASLPNFWKHSLGPSLTWYSCPQG